MNGATPGTVLLLAAAILLVIATVSVPVKESVYFLVITASRTRVKLGCLGYCIGGTCSTSGIGYKLSDADELFGVNTKIPFASKLSSGLIHGLTYTLVLHPIACGLTGVAFLLGILQHCTGFTTACLTTFVAGLASTVALVATALDFALFTLAKKRAESAGGSASYGIAIWLTLASFIVLVCSQCAFCCSCCFGCSGGQGRGAGCRRRMNKSDPEDDFLTPHIDSYGDQMRMDALQAEHDRLKRTANGTRHGDLPKFAEYETEHQVPLKHEHGDRNAHHPVRHAYAGSQSGQMHPNQYNSTPQGHGASYVPDVDPAYGQGHAQHDQPRDSAVYNNVGGFGAHGVGLDQSYGDDSQVYYDANYAAEAYQDYYNQPSSYNVAGIGDAAGATTRAVVRGNRSRQTTADDYPSTTYRSRMEGEGFYTPNVTSGYAQGDPSVLTTPVPQSAAVPERSVSVAPKDASRGERRLPTQHDNFGLEAIQAAAAAIAPAAGGGEMTAGTSASDEKQRLQSHLKTQDQEQQVQSSPYWQEPSGMYFDAETEPTQAGPSALSASAAGGTYDEQGGRWTRHSSLARDGEESPAHSDWVPTYEMAIGAVSLDEDVRKKQACTGEFASPTSPMSAPTEGSSIIGGRRPLPTAPAPPLSSYAVDSSYLGERH